MSVQDQVVNLLASRSEQFMARYGYEKIDTPIIQPADLFLSKAGDQIIHRLFTFERLGKQLALRPEFTALAAYLYNQQHPNGDAPVVRWQFGGAVFEDAPGDSQRFSIGAELISMAGTAAEAEIIALAANGVRELGLGDGSLVIGHVQLMRTLLERFKLDSRTQRFLLHDLTTLKQQGKAAVLEQLDRLLMGESSQEEIGADAGTGSELSTQQMLDVLLDATQHGVTMGGRTRHDIVRRLLQKRQRATERGQVLAALDFLEAWSAISGAPEAAFAQIEAMINDDEAQRILGDWRSLITLLDAYGIPAERIQIQPSLARDWDYYTGIVFELWSGEHHVGGGGRYDDLTRLIGGERGVPAVGFAYYVDPLLEALPEIKPPAREVMTIAAADGAMVSAIQWAQALRARGKAVILVDGSTVGSAFVVQRDGSLRQGNREYLTVDALLNDLERVR